MRNKINIGTRLSRLFLRSFLFAILILIVFGLFHFLFGFLSMSPNLSGTFNLDYDYSDIYFSHLKSSAFDNQVVVVDIDSLDRSEISELILQIQKENPISIGIDVLFDKIDTTIDTDRNLVEAMDQTNIVCLGENLLPLMLKATVAHPVLSLSPNIYRNIRTLPLYNKGLKAFSYELASSVKSISTKADPLIIDYLNGEMPFRIISYKNLSDDKLLGVKDKIVLLGKITNSEQDIEDKYYTPLNKSVYGNALPDMNGVLVHAQAIRSFLDKRQITLLSKPVCWSIFFVFLVMQNLIFIPILSKDLSISRLLTTRLVHAFYVAAIYFLVYLLLHLLKFKVQDLHLYVMMFFSLDLLFYLNDRL